MPWAVFDLFYVWVWVRTAWNCCLVDHSCFGLKIGVAAMLNFALRTSKNKAKFRACFFFFCYVNIRVWITFLLCGLQLWVVLRKFLQHFLFLGKTQSIQSLWKGLLPELNSSEECFTVRAVMWPLAVVSIHGNCSWCAQNHNGEICLALFIATTPNGSFNSLFSGLKSRQKFLWLHLCCKSVYVVICWMCIPQLSSQSS